MIFSQNALQDKHILITGATGGIGYETAKTVVQMGANVTITGRKEEKLNELKNDINEDKRVFIRTADLNNEKDRKELVEEAIKQHGPIYGLVNSAGISGGTTVEDLDEDTLQSIIHTNFISLILLTQEAYRSIKKQKQGAVVNVSSLSGLRGTYANTAYAGSKFALIGFTQSFALEAIEYGVRVNAVCPGFVNTEMGRTAINNKAQRNEISFEDQFEKVKEGLPASRITEPNEVARSIAFLLTDAANNIIGESLKISGGSVMR